MVCGGNGCGSYVTVRDCGGDGCDVYEGDSIYTFVGGDNSLWLWLCLW